MGSGVNRLDPVPTPEHAGARWYLVWASLWAFFSHVNDRVFHNDADPVMQQNTAVVAL